MAGESPDKSEQQQSSGTTRDERDPRLGALRDPEPGSGSAGPEEPAPTDASGESGSGDAERSAASAAEDADTTAEGAGSALKAAEEPGTAPDAPQAAPDAPETAEDAEGGDPAEGDARLRAAVAAWVSTADDEKDTGGADAPAAPAADEKETSGADAPVAPAADEKETSAAEPPTTASAPGGVASADAAAPGGQASAAEASAPVAGASAPGGKAPSDSAAPDEQASAAEASAPGTGKSAPGEGASADAAAPGGKASAAEASAPGTGKSVPGEQAPAAEASAPGTGKSAPDEGASADAAAPGGKAPAAEASAPVTGKSVPDEQAPAAEASAPVAGKSAPDEQAPAAKAPAPVTGKNAPDEQTPAAEAPAPAPVDQPTAVFKAPRLPEVDQPTTALKITRSPSGRPVAAETESLTERTSQFVPLRSDDVRPAQTPAPRRPGSPAPGSGAPAALSGAERTRQQPMPPKPPLDLLAELTNTPPPPETPVRTAVRRVKIWTPLVILLLIVFAIVQMVRPLPDPSLVMTAKETYTFGGGELKLDWPSQGQSAVTVDGVGSLGSAGAQKPAPIASVAKIMTAYVILQGHPLKGKDEGEKITVDQQAEDESKAEDESTAPISKGQQFTEKQMLQLLMIPSGNNAARLFARWDSSSEAAFVEKMNDEAKKLGMTDTTYTDPSGLKKTTVSTAADQLKLAQAVMKNEVFREIVDTPQIKIDGIDTMIYNNNTLLLQPGVSGIKTGSSTPAGGNLIWSANTVVDGKKLWIYGAVMGQQAGTGQPYDSLVKSLDNSLKLIKGAQDAVTSAKVVHKGDVVGYVDDGFGGRTPLVATADLKATGWPGLRTKLSVEGNGKEITRSMKAGTEVGVVTVGTGSAKASAPVALQQDLADPSFGQKMTRIG
ncbi:D-alanyl-D-alanine carboxypeptidase [Streptomyces sp. 130]|nr:D-alanyl-D-alanine carboxypeptidase [Streptomyces sp. 130]